MDLLPLIRLLPSCLAAGTVLFSWFIFQLLDYKTFILAAFHIRGSPFVPEDFLTHRSHTLISVMTNLNVLIQPTLAHPSELSRKIKILNENFSHVLIRLGSHVAYPWSKLHLCIMPIIILVLGYDR